MGVELYQFQQEDVDKLVKMKAALIGSEMGAGKTHEGIALDELWHPNKKAGPTLVVAPLNTFSSWQEKYADQSPSSDVVTIDRKNRDAFANQLRRQSGDVFLMHWDALRAMPELGRVDFSVIIADEVHRASNKKAQATRALKKLRASHKLGMSGTASGDKPENLWSILNWLWPTYYSSYWRFRRKYCIEEMVYGKNGVGYSQIIGVQNLETLQEEMAPWYVRHLKKEQCCPHHPEGVMPWLPDKAYSRIWVDLTPTQKKLYDQMAKEMVAWVGEHEDSPLMAGIVVAQMTRLSQMALATPYFLEDGSVGLTAPSSKIDALKELLKDNPNKPMVVFSSSKKAIYLARQELLAAGITCQAVSGDTPDHERQQLTNNFRRGDFQVVLGVIQAIAEGVDGLQHTTDTGVFLDRSWSTIKNMQAEDRLHRDGQKDAVNIIDIMARGTLDWGRHQRLQTKWSWIKAILGDIPGAQSAIAEGEEVAA